MNWYLKYNLFYNNGMTKLNFVNTLTNTKNYDCKLVST